jgi:hypothetical protein
MVKFARDYTDAVERYGRIEAERALQRFLAFVCQLREVLKVIENTTRSER